MRYVRPVSPLSPSDAACRVPLTGAFGGVGTCIRVPRVHVAPFTLIHIDLIPSEQFGIGLYLSPTRLGTLPTTEGHVPPGSTRPPADLGVVVDDPRRNPASVSVQRRGSRS